MHVSHSQIGRENDRTRQHGLHVVHVRSFMSATRPCVQIAVSCQSSEQYGAGEAHRHIRGNAHFARGYLSLTGRRGAV